MCPCCARICSERSGALYCLRLVAGGAVTSQPVDMRFTCSRSLPNTGANTQAGANRALKVGKAGVKCSARFQSQHYSPRAAPSTLAATLLKTKILWPFIGMSSLDASNVWGCSRFDNSDNSSGALALNVGKYSSEEWQSPYDHIYFCLDLFDSFCFIRICS